MQAVCRLDAGGDVLGCQFRLGVIDRGQTPDQHDEGGLAVGEFLRRLAKRWWQHGAQVFREVVPEGHQGGIGLLRVLWVHS